MCLNSGLKTNTANATGNTLLMEASKNGSYAVAKLLLAHGAKVNAQNELGNTALMEATLRGDAQMTALLLHAGANASIINSVGETAFTIAEGFDQTAIAKLLTAGNQNTKEGYAKLR
ncbi:ankyrin like protein [Filimonas lacunae]|nr:ankyrin like protein [Filimonas lacunae]